MTSNKRLSCWNLQCRFRRDGRFNFNVKAIFLLKRWIYKRGAGSFRMCQKELFWYYVIFIFYKKDGWINE